MNYHRGFEHSIQVSEESSFSEYCPICTSLDRGLVLWIRGNLYAKENNYYGRYIKTTNSILERRSGKYMINYKQAMIAASDRQIKNFQYKKFNQIIQEIKHSITVNIHGHRHYDKLYFGENNYQTMLKYQAKKKALLITIQNNKSQHKPKFKINKSAVSTDSEEKILQDSTLNKKYDFYPVEVLQRQEKSKFELSLFEIEKLKKNLSIMIGQLKVGEQTYPQTKDLTKPYIDFIKSKQELKFRKRLENNISEIHQQKNRLKKSQNVRLYTSPDPQDDWQADKRYGFLFQQNPELKRKKKKSLLRKQLSRDKSATNLSRAKLINNKGSRQVTEQGSHLIICSSNGALPTMNSRKSKSKSKLKGSSKSKILLATSSSRNKLKTTSTTMDKSLNKSKKLLIQYKG